MHRCANINNDVCKFTGLQHGSIEQHIEMYVARRKHDNNDMKKIRAWFNKHIPFDSNNSLRSLSLGLSATENNSLSCNDAECRISWKKYSCSFTQCMCRECKNSTKRSSENIRISASQSEN